MILSGVKDYRVDYKNYQDWIIPKAVVVSLFSLGVLFVIIGIIFLAVGGGGGLTAAGAIFLGLGLSLLAVCLLLCLHAYCVRYIKDQQTQTKDAEAPIRDGMLSAYPLVTSKPPQGVLKTGRSPVTEHKRVRLQAEKDTGLASSQGHSGQAQSGFHSGHVQSGSHSNQAQSGFQSSQTQSGFQSSQAQSGFHSGQTQSGQSGQTQSLSSQFLSERFPLRTPDFKEDTQQTTEKKAFSATDSSVTENHYETLPLRADAESSGFASRRPGEVLSRSQESDVSRQVSSTQVVYPQQVGPIQSAFRFDPPPAQPVYPAQTTNLSNAGQKGTVVTYRSESIQRDPNLSILKSPFPLASGQYQHTSQKHYQTSQFQSKPTATSTVQQYSVSPEAQASGTIQHYHVSTDSRPIKVEQYYRTFPQTMSSQQRQMATEYHWSDVGSSQAPSTYAKSTGQEMSFEDYRSSKMSLYDNLNGVPEGGATI